MLSAVYVHEFFIVHTTDDTHKLKQLINLRITITEFNSNDSYDFCIITSLFVGLSLKRTNSYLAPRPKGKDTLNAYRQVLHMGSAVTEKTTFADAILRRRS